jgi:hypothetical protein
MYGPAAFASECVLISHTGNVYQRFLYKEKDDRSYPLELLRNAALAKTEQQIAYQLWQDFMKRMAVKAVSRRE